MSTIRALVVDDEPIARDTVRALLEAEVDVQVVASCGSCTEALAVLEIEDVDLVFLDIGLPDLPGIDLAARLPEGTDPLIVFVTAHDEHAVRAFEMSALDYVLKPFDDRRFAVTLGRARARLHERKRGSLERDLRDLVRRLPALAPPADAHPVEGATTPDASSPHRLAVRSSQGVDFIDTEDIDWIEAEGSYVRVWVGPRFHLMRETMSRLEALLSPDRFVRVHRSAIVHVEKVRRLVPLEHGDSKVVLDDGTEVRVSRTRRTTVRAVLGVQPEV